MDQQMINDHQWAYMVGKVRISCNFELDRSHPFLFFFSYDQDVIWNKGNFLFLLYVHFSVIEHFAST